AHTRQRIEDQLLLRLDGVARLLGPAVIEEIAFSIDDLHLLDGTGIAVLFRTSQPELLLAALNAEQEAALARDATVTRVTGKAGALDHSGGATPARTVPSHVMRAEGNIVVVSNSIALLERIAAPSAGTEPAVGGLDEYRFFRTRYLRGA